MNRVTAGVLLSLSALILIHFGQPFFGIPLFVAGIIAMNGRRRKK